MCEDEISMLVAEERKLSRSGGEDWRDDRLLELAMGTAMCRRHLREAPSVEHRRCAVGSAVRLAALAMNVATEWLKEGGK